MNSEITAELIWHFAGYLHIAQDFTLSRTTYETVHYQTPTISLPRSPYYEGAASAALPEMKSLPIRVSYAPKYDRLENVPWEKLQHEPEAIRVELSAASAPSDIAEGDVPDVSQGSSLNIIYTIRYLEHIHTDYRTDRIDHPGREPIYKMQYTDGGDDKIAEIVQQNASLDKDFFSDGGESHGLLQHIRTGDAVPDMIKAAGEFIPDLLHPLGQGGKIWTDAILDQHEALEAGERTAGEIAPGHYVNGQWQGSEIPAPVKFVHAPPALPEHDEDSKDPAQIAELGANHAQNIAIIADLNDAPSTLIVGGNYFETNAIYQANVLRDMDHLFEAGSGPGAMKDNQNRTDNIADLVVEEMVKKGTVKAAGNLKVNVEYVDGDFFDVKTLTQRNFIDDGDVSSQTMFDSYSQVLTGGNKQTNVARFEDWGKHYDIIIVVGDYHSANIISQTNVLFDSDVVGQGGSQDFCPDWNAAYDNAPGGAGNSALHTGQNALVNEAGITNYGATSFAGLTGDMEDLIAALSDRDNIGREAWTNFHGAASGSLDVLFVTGNFYDLNIISQMNVVADADLAIQMSFGGGQSGQQWLSVGGNSAFNLAKIINAGGLHKQYLGGSLYEDSVLVQANLVSEDSHGTGTSPVALVPELVAFMDHPHVSSPDEGGTWTWSNYSNHDSFGQILT